MRSKNFRVLFVSAIMILSSLAGCLGGLNDTSDDGDSTESLGFVMVSTYHVGELVKGIAGSQVTMEYMSLDNIPVHDYEPSASDLIRLQNADVFFYHGLGLEPWVESTLSSLGADAPTSIEVHTMPTGQETLDYEGVLVTDLCATLSEGPFENAMLVDERGHADDVEVHAEYTAYNVSFPHEDHDDGHDGHAEHDDGHAEHDDGHDEHDAGHEGHAHVEAEETIANPTGCPADSVISIFELEEGEYVLEFDAEHPEDFTMAVLKMGGGHAHHDHGEEHGVCHDMSDHTNTTHDSKAECEAAGLLWMEEEHDEHDGEHFVCHDTTTHLNTNHSTEADCEAAGNQWMKEGSHSAQHGDYCHNSSSHLNTNHTTKADCEAAGNMWMEAGHHDGEMTPERALRDFDSNNDSHLSWDEFWAGWEDDHDEGSHHGHSEEHHNVAVLYPDNSMALYEAEHDALPENATGWNLTHAALNVDGNLTLNVSVHPTFGTSLNGINGTDAPDDFSWYWQLMLWNSTSTPPSWEPSQHGIDSVMVGENFSNVMGSGASEAEHIAWAVNTSNHSLLPSQPTHEAHEEHDAHEEHEAEMLMAIFNESDTNNDNLLNMSELGHFVEEVHEFENRIPTPEEALELHDANNDTHISWNEFWTAWTTEEYGGVDHDDHDEHAGHSGHAQNVTTNATHDDHDEHEEEMLMEMFNESDMNADGLLNMSELGHFIEDVEKWVNPPLGFAVIHILAEGDYGFVMPADVGFHILMGEGGHEGHAGHDGHGDEHGDDHDADGDNHSAEETLNYDPHSWLSPLAFKAQVSVVMNGLTTAFPDGEEDFKANAELYSAQLTALDTAFDAAFGDNGACMAGSLTKTVAANHNAYSYIAVEYGIQFVTVHGLDPEGEPSPEDIAKVVNFIKEEGITVLFVEEYTDQSSVQSIVDETGVTVKILYTMEMAPSDSSDNYMTMMTKNLENLISGIGC